MVVHRAVTNNQLIIINIKLLANKLVVKLRYQLFAYQYVNEHNREQKIEMYSMKIEYF